MSDKMSDNAETYHRDVSEDTEMKQVQKLQPPFSWWLTLFHPHIKGRFSDTASHEFAGGDHFSQ